MEKIKNIFLVSNSTAFPQATNGPISVPSLIRIGQSISYVCPKGRILIGSSSNFCNSTGQWVNPAPSCEFGETSYNIFTYLVYHILKHAATNAYVLVKFLRKMKVAKILFFQSALRHLRQY